MLYSYDPHILEMFNITLNLGIINNEGYREV